MEVKAKQASGLFGPEDERIDRAIDATSYNRSSPYNHPGFRPVRVEHRHAPVQVEGKLPDDLCGVYLRNGTNIQFDSVTTRDHCFNGAGMLHQVQIGGGAASYSNTYIRTPRFEFEQQAGREVFPSYGDMALSGPAGLERLKLVARKQSEGLLPRWTALEANPASTSVQHHHGRLYCLQGSGLPFVLDAQVDGNGQLLLDGRGHLEDWNGRLRVPFSAHPRVDPFNGDFYNIALDNRGRAIWQARLHEGQLDEAVKVEDLAAGEPLPGTIHDYFLTDNYIVIPDVSLRFSETHIAEGGAGFWRFDASRRLRWGVLPRRPAPGDRVRWFETDRPGMVWHVVNAWEHRDEQGRARIELFAPVFDSYPETVPIHTPGEPPAQLTKWVLGLDEGRVLERRTLLEHGFERPSLNLAFVGRRSRYAYLLDEGADGYMGKGVLKYDLLDEAEIGYFSYGSAHGGEALFVPRAGGEAEDDGYLLDLLMDGEHAELLVLDAASMQECCRLRLPARVPFGVHACWLTQRDINGLVRSNAAG